MKIRKFLLMPLLLFIGICNNANAESTDISQMNNAIYIEDFEAGIGKQVIIPIKMKNAGNIRGYQCDIYLPDGMSFAKDGSNNPIAKISGERTTTEYHSLMKSIQSDGALRLLCNASEVHYFSGNDGEVAQVTVDVDEDMEAGNYPIYIKRIKMGATSNPSEGTNIDDIESTVTIAVQDYDVLLDEYSTTAPEACSNVKVMVKRTINANTWNTICLPFAMTEAQVKAAFGDDVELGNFQGVVSEVDDADNVTGIAVNFEKVDAIESNHPYIIKVSSDINDFSVNNVDVAPNEDEAYIEFDNGRTGSRRVVYSGFYGTYHAGTVLEENTLFLNSNKFYYSKGSTNMKAYRAYFEFLDVLTAVEEAAARLRISYNGEMTNIENTDFIPSVNGRVYSVGGQYLGESKDMRKLPKGVYIIDGKKKVIK